MDGWIGERERGTERRYLAAVRSRQSGGGGVCALLMRMKVSRTSLESFKSARWRRKGVVVTVGFVECGRE